ncbi:MAG: hypothetical protein ACYTGC_12590, partial [Planctomycetota bacterium]|jgi:hypothetical protein
MHDQYTTPADRAYTVNPAGAAEVVALIESVAMELAGRPELLSFNQPAPGRGANRGYAGVRLGIRRRME